MVGRPGTEPRGLLRSFVPHRGSGAPAAVGHFDGVTWTVTAAPASVTTLAGITTGSRGIWAVGAGDSPQPPFAGPSAISWHVQTWTDRAPRQAAFGRLNAITTSPDGKVWTAGQQILPNGDDTALILNR